MSRIIRLSTILALLSLLFFTFFVGTVYANISYTVKTGDSLWNISQRYNTSVNAIKEASNHWSDTIMPGQELVIPFSNNPKLNYTVQAGDSLWNISFRLGTSVNSIKEASNLSSNNIYPGQELQVPLGLINPSNRYFVNSGDTLWQIAHRFNTTINAIKASSNHWSDMIMPEQRLNIPSGTTRQAFGSISNTERELLGRLVQAEAEGEPYTGKVAVVAVVLNRVTDPRFPNTIADVIYENRAFEVVSNGLIWKRVASAKTQNAVEDALRGWDPSYGSLFFWNPYHEVNPWIWTRAIAVQLGNHVFAH